MRLALIRLLLRRMHGQVALARFYNAAPRLARPTPALCRGDLALQLLVDAEEVFQLALDVREDLIHRVDLVVARILAWHSDDLLVLLVAINHVQHPDRPHFNQTSRKARRAHQRQHVQRIVILGQRAGNEAVVAWVVYR